MFFTICSPNLNFHDFSFFKTVFSVNRLFKRVSYLLNFMIFAK